MGLVSLLVWGKELVLEICLRSVVLYFQYCKGYHYCSDGLRPWRFLSCYFETRCCLKFHLHTSLLRKNRSSLFLAVRYWCFLSCNFLHLRQRNRLLYSRNLLCCSNCCDCPTYHCRTMSSRVWFLPDPNWNHPRNFLFPYQHQSRPVRSPGQPLL